MEDTKTINYSNDTLNEVKIFKPKPVRKCPNSKKSLKSSRSSSTSTFNSEISTNQINIEKTKIDFENISIEEINTDFFLCSQYLEEEQCMNELYDIMNNSNEQNEEEIKKKKNIHKIKRCENPLKKELEMLSLSYFDELMEDFNDFECKENENKGGADDE